MPQAKPYDDKGRTTYLSANSGTVQSGDIDHISDFQNIWKSEIKCLNEGGWVGNFGSGFGTFELVQWEQFCPTPIRLP